MPTIKFIIQGNNAADIALELQQYLQDEWQTKTETELSKTPSIYSVDSQSRGFDPNSIEIIMSLYGGYKLFKDMQEVVSDSKKLLKWLEDKLTNQHEKVWLSINGIPYPVKLDELENIVKALEKPE